MLGSERNQRVKMDSKGRGVSESGMRGKHDITILRMHELRRDGARRNCT